MFNTNALKVVPLAFQVCVALIRGCEVVSVAPVRVRAIAALGEIVPLVLVQTPSTGVTNVGLVARTFLPVPVLGTQLRSVPSLDNKAFPAPTPSRSHFDWLLRLTTSPRR